METMSFPMLIFFIKKKRNKAYFSSMSAFSSLQLVMVFFLKVKQKKNMYTKMINYVQPAR